MIAGTHQLPVHVAFESQVARTPAAVAVVSRDAELTYAELNAAADGVARRLWARGVRSGDFVGICLDRSVEQIAAVLGVLKAGAVYVPLDVAYPRDRLEYMLDDAGVKVCIARSKSIADLGLTCGLAFDCVKETVADEAEYVAPAVSPDHLIYMIYTSGSTGKPKGAQVYHGGFSNLVAWYVDEFEFSERSVVLHVSSPAFDLTQKNIFAPLLVGGRLCLLPEGYADADLVATLIHQWSVTTINCTPSAFDRVVAAASRQSYQELASLQYVFLGGEPIVISRLIGWLNASNCRAQIVNTYGPTECTDVCAFYRVAEPQQFSEGRVPIGFAVPGFDLIVVNDNFEPVADGDEGQLLIGGVGVGAGYHNRSELNAEKFIAAAGASRAYLSGDWVKKLPDGAIDYLGRIDTQVKIRGFRIELGEIEAVLERHADVDAAAVAAIADAHNELRLAAYIVPASGQEVSFDELRAQLAAALPEYMIPANWQLIAALPLTPNGKLDRKALPKPEFAQRTRALATEPGMSATENFVAQIWHDILGVERIAKKDNFFELGGSSLLAMDVMSQLNAALGTRISVTNLFDNPALCDFVGALWARAREELLQRCPADAALYVPREEKLEVRKPRRDATHAPIAIIGVAGRFPGARYIDEFWRNLCDGVESTTTFTDEELDPSIPQELKSDPDYVKARGIIPEPDLFDAAFFGMSPREAAITDPQQRIFLETAWEALEDAALVPSAYDGRVGVYAGVGVNTYYVTNVLPAKGVDAGVGEIARIIATEKDYVANRLSFKLNLTGPAVSVHTACSTSLVAVVEAINALRLGFCEVAIAGGVSVHTPINCGYSYQQEGVLSPDGISRPFDASSAGTAFNSGAAVVILKPLQLAIDDGDRIYGVITGVGLNNDGSDKASFMAPSVKGQRAAILQAQHDAGIDARTIGYVEAHGTATPIGDPIEVEALTEAFYGNSPSRDRQYCAIGSIKSNFGHLVAAAGTAGLIKTVLALHRQVIPPTINFTAPNPLIDFERSPFFVASKKTAWPRGEQPRRAAVSSFGIGGTNAHVVLEEAPALELAATVNAPELLLFSAKKADRLPAMRSEFAEFFDSAEAPAWSDAAWTLQRGRARFNHRQFVVLDPAKPAAELLREPPKTHGKAAAFDGVERGVVFMFPGQGSQYVGMGQGLYERYPVFREVADQCFELLRPRLPRDLREVMFATPGADLDAAAALLKETQYTQLALFVIEYALARLWMSWGVQPTALIGHSIGEFVAATLAGVFTLEEGLALVAERARLMQAQPHGAMLAVSAPAATLKPQLPASCDIAAINGPELCVVAGPDVDVDVLAVRWQAEGLQAKRLHTSHAFHSPMMEPAIPPFAEFLNGIQPKVPAIPIMSTVDVAWLTPERATDREYWARHLRETVKFADGARTLLQGEPAIYLEVGPRNTAATLTAQQMRGGARHPVITSLGANPVAGDMAAEQVATLAAAGELWLNGVELAWSTLYARLPQIVSLPTYPFARDRYWIEPSAPMTVAAEPAQSFHLLQPQVMAALPTMSLLPVEPASVALPLAGVAPMDQQTQLMNDLRDLFAESSGEDLSQVAPDTSFLELGFDSLFLTQAALALKKRYKIDIPFRRLMSDLADFGSLTQTLMKDADPSLLPSVVAAVPVVAAPTQAAQTAPVAMPALSMPLAMAAAPVSAAQLASVQGLIQQQLQLMAAQLQMLGGVAPAMSVPIPAPQAPIVAAPVATVSTPSAATVEPKPAAPAAEEKPAKPFGAQTRIDAGSKDEFTPVQRGHYQQLLAEYTARTAKSKAFTTQARPKLADPRVVSGFRPVVKEITYPIVVDRSKGCRLWDLDGNEYIDTLCGYGSMFFGYQPDWIVKALNEQLERGMEIGPQHPMTHEVIELLSEILPHERYAFCNTGSEAVLGAMRMARTASGRNKIVMFNGDYHGIVDEVIVRGGRNHKSFPAAAGIMPDAVKHMVVLEYGSDEALDYIRDNAEDIAGVLVETVQSRHPGFVPIEFLKKLRTLTAEKEIGLIFDEVITGFRIAPGGFQEYAGIQADICTYGKVIGGGISLGLIAGRARFMDTLDGGAWQFGDDSKPEVGVTYFAGTFVRHPLALAAAKAVLLHLKEQGPQLQQRANDRAMRFARDLNLHFKRVGAPMEIEQFCSLMYFKFTEELPFGELMFCDMRREGIHAWYGRPMFVSTAHTEEDLAEITSVFKRSLARMQEWGFIPGSSRDADGRDLAPPVAGARLQINADGHPAWFVDDEEAAGGVRQVGAVFD